MLEPREKPKPDLDEDKPIFQTPKDAKKEEMASQEPRTAAEISSPWGQLQTQSKTDSDPGESKTQAKAGPKSQQGAVDAKEKRHERTLPVKTPDSDKKQITPLTKQEEADDPKTKKTV